MSGEVSGTTFCIWIFFIPLSYKSNFLAIHTTIGQKQFDFFHVPGVSVRFV